LKISLDVAIFLCGVSVGVYQYIAFILYSQRILQCIRVPAVDDSVGVNSRMSGRCGAAVCTEQPTTSWRQC